MCLWGQVSQFHFSPEFDFLISAAFHANETLEITEHFDPVTNGCLTFWHFPSVTVSLEAQMVSGSEVGESHSMEYSHTPQGGLRTKSLEFGKEVKTFFGRACSPSVLNDHTNFYPPLFWIGMGQNVWYFWMSDWYSLKIILPWTHDARVYRPNRATKLVRAVYFEVKSEKFPPLRLLCLQHIASGNLKWERDCEKSEYVLDV